MMTAQMQVHGCGYHKLGLEVCRDIHVKNVDTIQMTHTKQTANWTTEANLSSEYSWLALSISAYVTSCSSSSRVLQGYGSQVENNIMWS